VDGGLHGRRRRRSFETNRFDRMANDAGACHPARALLGSSWPCAGLLVQSAPRATRATTRRRKPRPAARPRSLPPPRTHEQTPSRAAADRRKRQSIGAFLPQRDEQVITIAD
jgi:hypothetical protein